MSSIHERMIHHLRNARAKIQYIDGQQTGDTPRIERAAMDARAEIDRALHEAGVHLAPGWFRGGRGEIVANDQRRQRRRRRKTTRRRRT